MLLHPHLLFLALLRPAWTILRNEHVSGGFGNLEISPTRLTRIEYGGVHLPIWEHKKNDERDSRHRQYFTLPLVQVTPNSAVCTHNVFADAIILQSKIVMWSDTAESEILTKLRKFTRIQALTEDNLLMIPIERIRFIWNSNLMSKSHRFLLDDAWRSFALKSKIIRLSIHCDTMRSCERLRDNINIQPSVLDSLELQFSLQSKKSVQTRLRIRGNHITNSSVLRQIISATGRDGNCILRPDDIRRISQEVVTKVVAERETDSGYVQPSDGTSTLSLMEKALKMNPVMSSELSTPDWASVHWFPKSARPDLVTSKLNEIFQKKEDRANEISIDMDKYAQLKAVLPDLTDIAKASKSATIGSPALTKWISENAIQSIWTGDRFVAKPIKLYRINLSDITARREFVSTDVQVYSKEHVYSLNPIILDGPTDSNSTLSATVVGIRYKLAELRKDFQRLVDSVDGSKKEMKGTIDSFQHTMNALSNNYAIINKDISDPLRKRRKMDRVAQSICSTMKTGWIFAVRRTVQIHCDALCQRKSFVESDAQTRLRKRGCAGSVYVYTGSYDLPRNSTALMNGDVGAYKVYNYGSCRDYAPNYCCCTAN